MGLSVEQLAVLASVENPQAAFRPGLVYGTAVGFREVDLRLGLTDHEHFLVSPLSCVWLYCAVPGCRSIAHARDCSGAPCSCGLQAELALARGAA